MSSSTAASLRQPQNLAELLDGRPDTREMISANLNLAHACLLLKQGEAEEVERALDLAGKSPSKGMATISRCIRAEVLRMQGETERAWDLAEELVQEDRFDTVAALYLRFLFPHHKSVARTTSIAAASIAATVATPAVAEEAPRQESAFESQDWDSPSAPVAAPEPPAPPGTVPEPVAAAASTDAVAPGEVKPAAPAEHDSMVPSVPDSDSEVSITLDPPPEASHEDAVEAEAHEMPGVLGKISQDPGILLMRLRVPSGETSEVVRPSSIVPAAVDPVLLDRPRQILSHLGFGSLVHASFESATGAAHSWVRQGRSLVLVVDGSTSAPALAARCTRAMEEGP